MKKRSLLLLLGVLALASYFAFRAYEAIYAPITFDGEQGEERTLLLPQAIGIDSLATLLLRDSIISDEKAFSRVARLKRFAKAKDGRYVFQSNRSNNSVINKLRSGDQDPVRLSFNSTRTPEELAGRIAQQIMADSATLVHIMKDEKQAAYFGFNKENFRTMFIPNTYEIWWDTDAKSFVERMAEEYKSFWNEERKARAQALGMSQSEVIILASIVHAETAKRDEAPVVAGLYMNRLKIGMPLQADPTLIYALGDFSIRRVLDIHKKIDSPYNTYQNTGLPPGPVNFPDITYIEAVLNHADHDYIFMCAKADFSGYHHFSRTLSQHLQYAREYHRAISNR